MSRFPVCGGHAFPVGRQDKSFAKLGMHAFKWVAPLIGSGLAILGIFQIATRRFGMGILALAGGGALFAIERIANSLAHIAGNSGP